MTDITPERLARFEAHLKGWEECFLGEDGRWYVGTVGVMQVALTLDTADDREKWVEFVRPDIRPMSSGSGWVRFDEEAGYFYDTWAEALEAAVIAAMEQFENGQGS